MPKVFVIRKYLVIIRRLFLFDDVKRMQLDLSKWEEMKMIDINGVFFNLTITTLPSDTIKTIRDINKRYRKLFKRNESKN